jgi:glycerophosphoryl diester phosphodiesterase
VVFHDDTLERLTEATGAVAERTTAELSSLRLRGGAAIPTLEAFLARIGGRTPLVVEIKSRFDGDLRLADRVAALVSGHDRVAIESFDPDVMARCRALAPSQPLGLVGPAETRSLPDVDLAPHDFLSWAIADLAALRAGHPTTPLSTWTIRSRAQHDLAKSLGAQIVFERFVPD